MIELNKSKFQSILPRLEKIDFNYLFAKTVLEDNIDGKVFVDNEIAPSSIYVLHSYGMSLLFGDHQNESFNSSLHNYFLNSTNQRDQVEWMQVFPNFWHSKLDELLGKQLIRKKKQEEFIDENINA